MTTPQTPTHTPEPWSTNGRIIESEDGEPIVKLLRPVGIIHIPEAEANARRIVSCVNACKGINPEAVPQLVEALSEILSEAEKYGFGGNSGAYGTGRVACDMARAALAAANEGRS